MESESSSYFGLNETIIAIMGLTPHGMSGGVARQQVTRVLCVSTMMTAAAGPTTHCLTSSRSIRLIVAGYVMSLLTGKKKTKKREGEEEGKESYSF